MSRSPFADRPGFLTFEEFYLLPMGTEVETVSEKLGCVVGRWKRGPLSEDVEISALRSGARWFAGDAGLLPLRSGNWNQHNYTRLAQKPPSELDKLRQELNAARDTVERLAVQIEEMSK